MKLLAAALLILMVAATVPAAVLGQSLTESQQTARLQAAVAIFVPKVAECGPALLKQWGLTFTQKRLRFSLAAHARGTAVAGTQLGGDVVVLFSRFFDLPPEEAAVYLIHEWLHTQGLGEDESGGRDAKQRPKDAEITRSVRAACF